MAKTKAFTKKQEAQYNMLERVDNIALRHDQIVNAIPALRRHFARMRQIKATLSRIRNARFTRSEGATENKAGAGGLLIESMQAVGSTLLAFANDTGNFGLAELTDRTPTSFTRLRDGELPGLAARYLSAARQWATELADFGLTEESITDLEANKGRYEEWAQAPANAISDAKGKTSDLKTGFADVAILLRDKVDPLVRGLVKRFPDLSRDYKEARIIRRNPVVSKTEAPTA
ncbi:hypothetical protein [Flaviaesturariibacter aridisoli]|uniref:Uncharacterized protein n=1 Tax=Flaviaesturariibacter aridisoli TaxID=2545761 RepID=A0A4R4E444_9BACT|nr:hypothetical protein [Flaviaesturariibacter aridisoli]TCZ71408.1 hypothetical protein E0486_10025 [Flaviaesturariibacter aridisoli]